MQTQERSLSEPPRPHYRGHGFQPGYGHQPRRPHSEQPKVPKTLAPQNLVSNDVFWCEKCQVCHPESCPHDEQEGTPTSNNVNFAHDAQSL